MFFQETKKTKLVLYVYNYNDSSKSKWSRGEAWYGLWKLHIS